jgi:YegS/Rv2252/BmrU family lipid kinase
MISNSIHVIFNPTAGGGKAQKMILIILKNIRKRLGNDFSLWVTRGPGDATDFARRAVLSNCELIIAVGGDGTINEVINGLVENGKIMNPNCELGIVNCGTGGGLAHSLGIPSSIENQIELIRREISCTIDLGKISAYDHHREENVERIFVSESQVGIGADVASSVKKFHKRLGGTVAFGYVSFMEALKYRAKSVTVELGGTEKINGRFIGLAVGNGSSTAGGMKLTPNAKLNDGLMDILFIHDMHVLKRLKTFPKIYSGKHIMLPEFGIRSCKTMTVSSDEPVLVSVDGEVIGQLPCMFEIIPAALKVRCPVYLERITYANSHKKLAEIGI